MPICWRLCRFRSPTRRIVRVLGPASHRRSSSFARTSVHRPLSLLSREELQKKMIHLCHLLHVSRISPASQRMTYPQGNARCPGAHSFHPNPGSSTPLDIPRFTTSGTCNSGERGRVHSQRPLALNALPGLELWFLWCAQFNDAEPGDWNAGHTSTQ